MALPTVISPPTYWKLIFRWYAIERYFSEKIPFVSTVILGAVRWLRRSWWSWGAGIWRSWGCLSDPEGVTKPRRDGFVSFCREHGVEYTELYSMADSEVFIEELQAFVRENYREGAKIRRHICGYGSLRRIYDRRHGNVWISGSAGGYGSVDRI